MRALLLLLFLIQMTFLHAQSWCPPDAKWTYGFGNLGQSGYKTLKYNKDTIVDGQPCKKITDVLYFINYIDLPNPVIYSREYPDIFTYEQDGVVYMYNGKAFRPTFYFNTEVGDTLPYYNAQVYDVDGQFDFCEKDIRMVVSHIDNVLIENTTVRYYIADVIDENGELIEPYHVAVSEKLGAWDNFIVPFFACYTDSDSYWLNCYEDSELNYFKVDVACEHILSNKELQAASQVLSTPNPASQTISFHTKGIQDIKSIRLINLHGQLQKSYSDLQISIGHTIDISVLPEGMYMAMIEMADGQFFKSKFIKLGQ